MPARELDQLISLAQRQQHQAAERFAARNILRPITYGLKTMMETHAAFLAETGLTPATEGMQRFATDILPGYRQPGPDRMFRAMNRLWQVFPEGVLEFTWAEGIAFIRTATVTEISPAQLVSWDMQDVNAYARRIASGHNIAWEDIALPAAVTQWRQQLSASED